MRFCRSLRHRAKVIKTGLKQVCKDLRSPQDHELEIVLLEPGGD